MRCIHQKQTTQHASPIQVSASTIISVIHGVHGSSNVKAVGLPPGCDSGFDARHSALRFLSAAERTRPRHGEFVHRQTWLASAPMMKPAYRLLLSGMAQCLFDFA
jgi:hypothetical protein